MREIAPLFVAVFVGVVGIYTSVAWAGSEWNVAGEESPVVTKSVARKLNLNSATARELEKLPGIGRELAERVIQHRPYRKLDELVAKKVLSRKQFARIKERIRVNSFPLRSTSH
ncbi:helix-hairpin-helix domain-containing protein [Candidatus Methylomirabilis sp.]|uniref:ComEA family DNA-binding protein n=1 Tax=Candidatus Methylomirabilis sp. TaxID=2032687 RepID=UPI002A5B1B62|nr:helix-hairpin-helix domain-containing protein [Candidatus Methylomirabilis sp.]